MRRLGAPASAAVVTWLLSGTAGADGTLTDDIRIASTVLGYDLQYRVYLPDGYGSGDAYPVIFLTDGHNYIRRGRMPGILDRLIGDGEIEPVVAVFVDPRDPDDPRTNRRTTQFLCNADYLAFFVDELIPAVERGYRVATNREARTIMGVSFGGTNAACFGVLGFGAFAGIAMQSPANHPLPNLLPTYRQMPTLPLRIFLSTGVPDDNTRDNRALRAVLQDKGYEMHYVEVRQGHNWDNWRGLIDDALVYFYGANEPDR